VQFPNGKKVFFRFSQPSRLTPRSSSVAFPFSNVKTPFEKPSPAPLLPIGDWLPKAAYTLPIPARSQPTLFIMFAAVGMLVDTKTAHVMRCRRLATIGME
jgi:hypothetical protein